MVSGEVQGLIRACPREFRGLEEVCASNPNSQPREGDLSLAPTPDPRGLKRVRVLRAPECSWGLLPGPVGLLPSAVSASCFWGV